jgi:hypothetical protein
MPEKPPAIHDEGLITEALETIAVERGNFDRSFDLVGKLLTKFGETCLAERLYDAIPRERPWQDVADLFGILIWSTSDNGSALVKTAEQWLHAGNDLRQLQIALHLDVYPFLDRSEMESVFSNVARRHPEVASRCRELVDSRRQLREGRDPV